MSSFLKPRLLSRNICIGTAITRPDKKGDKCKSHSSSYRKSITAILPRNYPVDNMAACESSKNILLPSIQLLYRV